MERVKSGQKVELRYSASATQNWLPRGRFRANKSGLTKSISQIICFDEYISSAYIQQLAY
jgi:hypothetical protein